MSAMPELKNDPRLDALKGKLESVCRDAVKECGTAWQLLLGMAAKHASKLGEIFEEARSIHAQASLGKMPGEGAVPDSPANMAADVQHVRESRESLGTFPPAPGPVPTHTGASPHELMRAVVLHHQITGKTGMCNVTGVSVAEANAWLAAFDYLGLTKQKLSPKYREVLKMAATDLKMAGLRYADDFQRIVTTLG